MARYIINFKISALVMAVCLMPGAMALAEVEVVRGIAYDDQGQLAYQERHTITYRDGRILNIKTVYTDKNKVPIAKTESDFSKNRELGNYDFHDDRHMYHDGARVYADRIAIFHRESPHADLQLKYLAREKNQVLGQGFNQFLIGKLDEIAAGKVVYAKLVMPAKLDQFDVVIHKEDIRENRIHIRIDVDSWFLKLFVPHIKVVFDMKSRRLLSYHGVSMVADESGDTTGVSVSYDYRNKTTVVKADNIN